MRSPARRKHDAALESFSADADSDPTPSLLSEDIADDMVTLGISKTIVLFVGISARTSSVAGGPRPPEIVRQPSCVFVSSLEPRRWNVPVMVWYRVSPNVSALEDKSENKERGINVRRH